VTVRKKNQRRGNRRKESLLQTATRSTSRRKAGRRRVGRGLFWFLAVPVLAAGLIWGGLEAWQALFVENDFFQICEIEITTDGTLGAGHVQEYAKVRKGLNLFAVRPAEIRDSLLLVPVVANAQVGRRLPDTLVIEITERVAVARLGRPGAGTPLAVDSTRHVLGPSSVRASLPVILGVRDKGMRPGDIVSDPMMEQALLILDLCNQSVMRAEMEVATIDLSDEEQVEVGLVSGERVLLSLEGLRDKLPQLPVMRAVARDKGLHLAVYDMTVSRNYVGRPSDWTEPAPGTAP
jgi:cell division protein FtsQ